MRLLFLGTELDQATAQGLLAQKVVIDCVKNDDVAKIKSDTPYDLIVYAPSKLTALDNVQSIRDLFPKSWIVLVIETTWLSKKDGAGKIFNCQAKDEVWLKDLWQGTFMFSFQTFLKRCELQLQSIELSEQVTLLVKQLERDVELAAGIHRTLLPKIAPTIPGVDIAVRYLPAAGKGGDYYDIFEFGDKKRFGILVADSKSHGMAASLLAVLVKVRLEEMKERFPDSKSFVDFLNKEIKGMHEKEMSYLSLLYGIFDRASLTFQFTSAGHLRPILCRMGEVPAITAQANPALGGVDHFTFQETSIRLQPGDTLVFFTDGWEHLLKGKAGDQIREILIRHNTAPTDANALTTELMGIVDSFKAKEALKDDLTLIQLSVQEKLMYVVQG